MAEDMQMLNISSAAGTFDRKTNRRHPSSAEKWKQVSQSCIFSCRFHDTLMFSALHTSYFLPDCEALYCLCWCYRKSKNQRGRLSLSPKRAAPPNRGRLIKLVNSTHISKSCKPPKAPLRGVIIETQRRTETREKSLQQSRHQRWKHFQRKLPESMETMADHLSRHRLSSETTQRSLMSSGRCNTFELVWVDSGFSQNWPFHAIYLSYFPSQSCCKSGKGESLHQQHIWRTKSTSSFGKNKSQ